MAQYDINLREYWRILKKRKFVVIVVATVLGLFSTFFAILRAPQPLYTSVSSIKFEKETTVEGLFAQTISWSGGSDIETQISVIKSYPVLQRVAEKLHLIPGEALKEDGQLKENIIPIIESLQSKVAVSREPWTSILNISVTDRNPVFAHRLANTIALTYQEMHAEEQTKRTTEALKYINDQLKTVRENLRKSEEEFNRFSQDNQLISLDMQSEALLASSQEIQNEMRQLNEDKRELEGILLRLNQFIKDPSGSGHDFYSTKGTSQYQSVNDTLVSLLLKKDTLLEDFTPQHPEVVGISRKIIENARKMVILLKLQISDIEEKEINLTKELEKVDRKTNVLMDKKLEFDRLKRRVDSYNDMTALLETKNQEALIRKAEKPEEVTIVKPAFLPIQPINPPKTVTTGAMGIMIGLVLGIIIGFIVETFDTSLGAIEDVEETLGTQVLGIIPQADAKDIREGLKERYPEGIKETTERQFVYLVSHFVPKSMMAESFRALRTNVQFKDAEKKIGCIAVASTSPEEGKTLVAINLALTMAQAGMKVLLVGSDLRKPALDNLFGVERAPGLTDVLMGNYPWRDTVKTVTDIIMGQMGPDEVMMTPGLDNIHIITSGPVPPNPAELIDSQRLTDFIEQAKEDYNIIVFDSPPILSTADAAILGAKVDGVLLVYRVGAVSRGLLRRSSAQLERVQCNLLGVVLNGMRPDVSPDFQDYKYYSYYYSYGEEKKQRKSREHIKDYLFFRRKADSQRKKAPNIFVAEEGKGQLKKQVWRLNRGRLALLLVAVTFLAVGILWQSGILDSFGILTPETTAKKEQVRLAVTKGPSKTVASGMSEEISPKLKPTASAEKPAVERVTAVKKDASETAIPTEPKSASTKPQTHVSEENPGLNVKAPVAESLTRVRHKGDLEAPASSEEIPLFPYSILLSQCRRPRSAEEVVSHYRNRGLAPYWVKVEVRSGIWYRVFVGHFEDHKKAEKFKQEYRLKEGLVKKTEYAILIGMYSSVDQLQNKMLSLKKLGYFPYTTENPDGKFRLFIGAFITKEGAEKQYHDLKLSGIQSQVVKR